MAKVSIRKAVPDDILGLKALNIETIAEAGMMIPEPDDAATLAWILGVVSEGNSYVAVSDGEIVGSLGMRADHWPWAPKVWYMTNAWFYVRPAFRPGGTAKALIDKIKERAASVNVDVVFQVTCGDADVVLKDILIRRQGFKYLGGTFILQGGQ